MRDRTILLTALVVVGVVAGACAGRDVRPGDTPGSAAETTPASTSTAGTEESPEPSPTDVSPTPESSPSAPPLYKPGQPVVATRGAADYLEITVSKVAEKKKYGSGYAIDTPAKGNVYIEAYVTYRALADGALYNPYCCNDTAIDGLAFVLSGPEPALHSGTLPKGRKAAGWLVYEVPAKGRCVLSYGANPILGEGAVFEVLLRDG
ncbi:MAG: hypothetical protein C4343_01440 [Chloroflexota bacterium]